MHYTFHIYLLTVEIIFPEHIEGDSCAGDSGAGLMVGWFGGLKDNLMVCWYGMV